ncbi:MAG: hypothetical protein N2Z85_00240 [Patescibacteria group bacterium]|nr:hypothetical protein [Patescibacteria group bacterium]
MLDLYFLAILTFIILIIIFIVLSLILNYHWNRYEISIYRTSLIKKIYFSISGILIFIIFILLINLK